MFAFFSTPIPPDSTTQPDAVDEESVVDVTVIEESQVKVPTHRVLPLIYAALAIPIPPDTIMAPEEAVVASVVFNTDNTELEETFTLAFKVVIPVTVKLEFKVVAPAANVPPTEELPLAVNVVHTTEDKVLVPATFNVEPRFTAFAIPAPPATTIAPDAVDTESVVDDTVVSPLKVLVETILNELAVNFLATPIPPRVTIEPVLVEDESVVLATDIEVIVDPPKVTSPETVKFDPIYTFLATPKPPDTTNAPVLELVEFVVSPKRV